MKYWIIHKDVLIDIDVAKRIRSKLSNWTESEKSPNYVFIIGGDGTFIRHAANYFKIDVKIICINTGTLGFYSAFESGSDWDVNEITQESNYETFTILKIQINKKLFYGVNEFVLFSHNAFPIDIKLDNEHYQKFKGSGLMISTRTGSTGRNKSCGGAVIFPGVHAIQMLELAPVGHLKYSTLQSPIILPKSSLIQIVSETQTKEATLSVDGKELKMKFDKGQIDINAVESKCQLFLPRTTKTYIKKLHNTFIKE